MSQQASSVSSHCNSLSQQIAQALASPFHVSYVQLPLYPPIVVWLWIVTPPTIDCVPSLPMLLLLVTFWGNVTPSAHIENAINTTNKICFFISFWLTIRLTESRSFDPSTSSGTGSGTSSKVRARFHQTFILTQLYSFYSWSYSRSVMPKQA